jgi:hypothetical protein
MLASVRGLEDRSRGEAGAIAIGAGLARGKVMH